VANARTLPIAVQAAWLAVFGFLAAPASGADIVVAEGVDTIHAAVAQAAPGDTLVLSKGLYEVTHTVLIDKSLTIRGATTNLREVHIVAVDAEEFNFEEALFTDPLDRGHIFFVTAGAASVSFSYFTVKNAPETDISEGECEEEPPFGFGLNHAECFGDGIHTDGAGIVKVANVDASLNAGNGIYVDGATSAEMIDISAVNNGAFGIDVDTALLLSIRRSDFTANQISGVEASGHPKGVTRSEFTADVTIDDVRARNNGEIGIEVERFENATLRAVTCRDNREDGFDADRVSRVAISRSSFTGNLDDGLELFPVDVPPEEQPTDFPGNIVEVYERLTISRNVGEDIHHPPTEN
jgi:hypothetical protein